VSTIKKSDVKNHLSPGFRTKIHVCPTVSQPYATDYSVAEPGAVQAGPSDFAKDFLAEHSSSGAAVATAKPVTGSIVDQAPTVLKGSARV
jgi:hypothetical protein